MDLLTGVQTRVVPPPVPGAARPLTPLRPVTSTAAGAIPVPLTGPVRPPPPTDAFSDERPNNIRDNTETCPISSSIRASAAANRSSANSARFSASSARSRHDATSAISATSGPEPTRRSKHLGHPDIHHDTPTTNITQGTPARRAPRLPPSRYSRATPTPRPNTYHDSRHSDTPMTTRAAAAALTTWGHRGSAL
jgi:hypothetical protein